MEVNPPFKVSKSPLPAFFEDKAMRENYLPEAVEVEKKLLSALMLKEGRAIPIAAELLKPEELYREEHRIIYRALLRLYDSGKSVDILLVEDELKRTNELKKINRSYLFSLLDLEFGTARVEYYSHIIRENAQRRKLIELSMEMAEKARDNTVEVVDTIGDIDKALGEITEKEMNEVEDISAVLVRTFERINARGQADGTVTGTSTGLLDLDMKLLGLQKTDLLILAARPSMGKTALALNIAIAAARTVPTLIFSLEMSKTQLGDRLISAESEVKMSQIQRGLFNDNEQHRLIEAVETLAERKLKIDDTGNLRLSEIRMRARQHKHKYGLGLIVIDYIQLMRGNGTYKENRVQEVSEISRGLKALAKELDVPILALSQLSRGVEMRADKRPQLSDLRESGSIEQDADIVMFLYRDEYYNRDEADNIAELIIAKNRNGATGSIRVKFEKEYQKFSNLTRGDF